MDIRNPWTTYLTRSYSQIKSRVVQQLTISIPEMTNFSQSNLLMVTTDIFAGVAEMLNYYIDRVARELFPSTALRLSSQIKTAKQQGYNGTAAIAASSDVTLTLKNSGANLPATADINIPIGTRLQDAAGNIWTTVSPAKVAKGTSSTLLSCRQYVPITSLVIGVSTGLPHQKFKLGKDYCHGSISLSTNNGTVEQFEEVDNLGLYPGTAPVFIVYLEEDGYMYVKFGDGLNGSIPLGTISISLWSTTGPAGNVAAGSISTITLTTPPGGEWEVENKVDSWDGLPIENVYTFAHNIPRAAYTLQRAVTKKDFKYIAEMTPGIREAMVTYVCGGDITINIAPYTTGYATAAQILLAHDFVMARANITVGDVKIQTAGESKIHLGIEVKTYPNALHDQVSQDIRMALLLKYHIDNQAINSGVRLSDIYALVDSIANVDYVNIPELYTVPNPRSLLGNEILDYNVVVENTFSAKDILIITSVSNGASYTIQRGSNELATITAGTPVEVLPGYFMSIEASQGHASGVQWKISTQPYGIDQNILDGSIPTLAFDNLVISYI